MTTTYLNNADVEIARGRADVVGQFDAVSITEVFANTPEGQHVYVLDPGDGANFGGCAMHLPNVSFAEMAMFMANIGGRDMQVTLLYVTDELHEELRNAARLRELKSLLAIK